MSGLSFDRLTVRYPGVTAVDDVSLEVPHGRIVGLVGESGSGKSTLGRAAVGLAPVRAGRVLLDGEDITQAKGARRRRLGGRIHLVFQNPHSALDPRMTVGETVSEALTVHRGLRRSERRSEVARLLDLLELDPTLASVLPGALSGGQRQRVALARALAVEPEVLIADEITSALDASVQSAILNLIRELRDKLELTILFIGHNLAAVRYVADVIAVLRQGELVEVAPTDRLFAEPRHPYTRALLDSVPRIGR
ncbi:ABC transporter ATP-binding protein [Amycolatopsis orientalis]|uniref:ABC transporter ATP-binding protein n=1 Tax=Amycolatopsis orientalis TaxID=31958 RepID=A0A193BV92_AMYOR|nr:ABC transporter ATP-binding protein [Amycolatopsis orientalis]